MATEQKERQKAQWTGIMGAHFGIVNGPGPYKLLQGVMGMIDSRETPLMVEFTVHLMIAEGEEVTGLYREKLALPFEVALMGSTQAIGHNVGEPRNIRLLGRFFPSGQNFRALADRNPDLAEDLCSWRWEAVFIPHRGGEFKGLIFRRDEPIPHHWTL